MQNSVSIHFSSRSLIIDICNDSKQPLYKYLYKDFVEQPEIGHDGSIEICAKKMYEIPTNKDVTSPYVVHDAAKEERQGQIFKLAIKTDYISTSEFFEALKMVHGCQQQGNDYSSTLESVLH